MRRRRRRHPRTDRIERTLIWERIQRKNGGLTILNSTLFFWFFTVFSDVLNVNRREIDLFPCTLPHFTDDIRVTLAALADRLMQDFQHNARYLTSNYGKYGVLTIQSFQPRLSKPIIDEIDRVLARQYGLRDEELDFIVNYDIKYRIGAEPEADED